MLYTKLFHVYLFSICRTLGLSQILKKMDDAVLFAGAPVILAGDFNAEPDGEEFAVMRERKDYFREEGNGKEVTLMGSYE